MSALSSMVMLAATVLLLNQCRSTASSPETTLYKDDSSDPDPRVPYQGVEMAPVAAQPTQYIARLTCKRDSTQALYLQMHLNPQQHSLQKLALVYVGTNPKHRLKQVGEGTGHYDAKTERYYFTTFYQTISELPGGMYYNSDVRPIHGWVSPHSNTAALQPLKL
ncbi:hypothetical protein LGH70_06010 [Hymenobacter sp. BT635]|uniref:Secreted protein n=1 Tax=Hymenobacter nitidus TaxID=2880929 RepID=A0ABS8ABM1_9BACT|nr:hypothetical protein [Hymenobacter nitidus]MCB2377127.1 hypothetical protein [Hymenobacter nitidus]